MRMLKFRWLVFLSLAAACLAGVAAQNRPVAAKTAPASAAARSTADLSAFAPGYHGVVFTQLPVARAEENRPLADGSLRRSLGDGGRLMLLAKDGTLRNLTPGFASAADPAVSFDGTHLLFAGKKAAADPWNIFEMKADGSEVRQITRNMGNCRNPLYQSAIFYLDDSQPAHQAAFVSDMAGELNENGSLPATNLYSVRFDGSRLLRLTYGVSSSFDPALMPDGRIVFSNWQNRDLGHGPKSSVGLFGVHLDGTDYAAFSGEQGRRIKHMAAVTPTRSVVFIESDGLPWDGAGNLAAVNLTRNLHSYRALTKPEDGLYVTPSALPDGSLLVSRRTLDGRGTHTVYRFDPATGRQQSVFADPAHHNIQAVALAAHAEADGHSSVVEDDQQWSKIYGLSVFQSDLDRSVWVPGIAKRIRVIEGVPPKAASGSESIKAVPGHVPSVPAKVEGAPEVIRRLLGSVALEADGSFHLLVPPNTPIQLQLLDSDGMALRTSTWIWTKNNENRGCIGCHEDNELTPENVFPQALDHPAAELLLPPERRRTVDFERDIQPILAAKCANAACHGGTAEPSLGNNSRTAYERLAPAHGTAGTGYVDPGSARTSRLVWYLLGRNTARPWDKINPAPIHPMPPPGAPQLSPDEIETFIEWIDLGAQFAGTPVHEPARQSTHGGQR